VLSRVQTSCGWVYTYQLGFDLLKQYKEVAIKMYLADPAGQQKGVSWSVINL